MKVVWWMAATWSAQTFGQSAKTCDLYDWLT